MKDLILKNNQLILPTPDSFNSYKEAVAKIPLLSEERESELINKWVKNKDKMAARELVLSNLYLVVKIVNNHKNYGLPLGDLAQEGTVGLMKAIHKFDNSIKAKVRLATYAWYWIEAEIREFIIKNWRMVSLGTSKIAKKLFFGYRKSVLKLQSMGVNVTNSEENNPMTRQIIDETEIAKALNVPVESARLAQSFFLGKDSSINYLPSKYKEYDNKDNEVIDIPVNETPETKAIDSEKQYMLERIKTSIDSLPENHKKVIKSRFLTEKPKTLSVLSNELNLSIERIRQIENEAITKLKRELT